VAQAASQVAFAGNQEGGVKAAALRLPVFSLCAVVSGATIGSTLVFDGDLPTWGRALAACALLALLALRRPVVAAVLRFAKRFVKRLPEPDALPPQRSILRCYAFCLGNLLAFSVGFAVLLSDLSDVPALTVVAGMAAAWTAGYVVVPLPGGLGVREAVIVAALPEVGAGPLLAVSVAHRLLGLAAEALLAGTAHARALRDRRAAAQWADTPEPSN
jgi:glycosyltransferase 2 family protein